MKYVIRKHDGLKVAVVARQGDEICVKEPYPFWTPKGIKTKYLKLWHSAKGYKEVK